MPLITNFNTDPYYDDFNDNKDFHRILYKPGFAVQSRELIQSQTILQDQIKKFGDHVFKSGSIVTGGQITIQNTAYLNLASTFANNDISYINFDKQPIYNSANTKRAYVLKSYNSDAVLGQPVTLVINQLFGDPFTAGETIYTANASSNAVSYYANTAATNPTGNNQTFSINDGVFYYEGYFVKNQPQSVAVDKYSRTGNSIIGFEVSESIVDYTQDTTLLDPAQSSSNFQAPGADRYKITLTLANRALDSTDLTQFVELGVMKDGLPQKIVQTPIYAAIGDELARRTSDESGDYVIKNFGITLTTSEANSAYANIALSSGKAYIKGYEFQTLSPTIISIPKPRTVNPINNQRINSDFGYYIFANGLYGNFATNQYSNAHISLLDTGTANAYLTGGNTSIYANTIIGNAKIKLISFYSASGNTSESNNYIYKVFLTDINTRPIAANGGYGINIAGGTGTTSTIVLPNGFASNNDVYKGMTIQMVGGTPTGNPGDNVSRIITDYAGSGNIATVTPPFSTIPTSNFRFIMYPTFDSAESLVVINSSGARIASANISPLSKNQSVGAPPASITTSGGLFQPAAVQDKGQEPLLLRVGEQNVADNTIADFSYSYRRLYQSVGYTSGVSTALPIGTGESLQSATTTTSKQQYYTVVVTAPGTSYYVTGQTVPAQAVTVSTDSRTITVDNGGNMVANIYATINASNPTSKSKTYIKANTILVAASGGAANDVFGNGSVFVASLDGQTQITEAFLTRRPGIPQTLFVADVHSVNAIFDFNGTAVNTANYNALDKSVGSSANVTSRYSLSTGQKDSYYDWGGIVLKPGQIAPRGPLLVRYNRFKSTGAGHFNVDSYTRLGSQENNGSGIDYGDIPIYTSEDGINYKLSDYLDFRPVRRDATNPYTANTFVLDVDESGTGTKISEPGLDILTDYSYYLSRIDRIVLNKNRQFQVLQGTPSQNPVSPIQPDDSMSLYVLSFPAYLTYPSSTQIQTFNNRRYTMKDIGGLEKRIQNLELYTSLSIAELATLNKNDRTVRDQVGLSRPKNGVFVDSFADKGGAAITLPDFNAAIDIVSRQLRGSYNIASTRIFSNNSTANFNVEIDGPLLMLASSNTTFVAQNKASKTMNINPFNIVNYIGSVKLDPASDVWKSTTRLEAQNIDLSGGDAARDAWSSIQSTSWGSWNTQWTTTSEDLGTTTSRSVTNTTGSRFFSAGIGRQAADQYAATGVAGRNVGGGGNALAIKGDVATTTTTTTRDSSTLNASRTGILSQIVPQQLTQTMGDRLIDLSIVNYMRENTILVVAEKFKPFTSLHAFFDNVKVDDKIAKVNRFQFANNNLQYQTTLSKAETVTFFDVGTNQVIGSGGIVLTSNNNGYIVNLSPTASYGSWSQATSGIRVVGNVTGTSNLLSKWFHNTGIALAGGASTITLAYSAGGATDTADYAGQTIFIVNGTGKNQSAIISSYNPTTRVATITGTWSVNPDATSVYTIGLLETDEAGACAGVFRIPADTFRTGEKLVRLIDNEFGNIENSRTNGDASFYSQGMVDTKQETSITVFTPTVQRSSVTEGFSASTSSIKTASAVDVQKNVVVGYYDPLAQTFLINPNQYGQGVVIDSVRVCFKSKDATVPVSLQLRPVNNGYPSSATVYPFAEKTLTPDKVNVTTIPDMNDPNKYTEFKFDVPILLLPGEHSFVLVSNSNGYEAFVAEIGATDLRTSVKISEQPYTGSLFLSQNGSTWTADQTTDLMFTIQKRVFTTGVGYGFFESDMSGYSSNTVFDVMQLMTTDATIANTAVQYDFVSEMETGGQHPLLNIVPNEDYTCDDGYGRRILSYNTGNTTFQLRTTLSSSNPDISPMIDINRLNLLTIENKINNLPLQNSGFVIVNGGAGYLGNTTVTITNQAVGGGSGASAVGVVVGGVLTRIELTNPGSGYISSPTIATNSSAGTTATVLYNGEDRASGGNSVIRYITKKIQLASGFDAGDLRVYMDAYRPPGSGILVWYKLLSASDPSAFENNNWNLMTQTVDQLNYFATDKSDSAELVFAPGTYNSGTPDNKITYTSASNSTHNDFTVFAIKVVMYGTNTVDVPSIANFRVVALPASTINAG
jgi:hypothetical protein